MRSSSSRRIRSGPGCRLAIALGLALLAVAPPLAQAAVVFDLVLTGDSELIPTVGAPEPLSGTLRIEIDDPDAAVPTGLRVLALDVTSGGLGAMLDDEIASAGTGVLFPDTSFVIPALFLVLDAGTGPFSLAIPDVEGSAQLDGSSELLLETTFAIDADDPVGVVTVNVVAVPEASGEIVAGLAVVLLAAVSRSRRGPASSGRGADDRAARGRVRGSGT